MTEEEEEEDERGGMSVEPAVARRHRRERKTKREKERERWGGGGGGEGEKKGIGGRSAAGSQRYSRKSNEREPNEAILKGDIVGSLARRTNSITSSGIERRKREEAHRTLRIHRHEVDSTAAPARNGFTGETIVGNLRRAEVCRSVCRFVYASTRSPRERSPLHPSLPSYRSRREK